jgi:hypothetical protein
MATMWEEAVVAYFKVLSHHLPAGNEETGEKPWRVESLSGRAEVFCGLPQCCQTGHDRHSVHFFSSMLLITGPKNEITDI